MSDLYHLWYVKVINEEENSIPGRKKSCKLKEVLNPHTAKGNGKKKKSCLLQGLNS